MTPYKYISPSEIDGDVKTRFLHALDRFIGILRSIFSIHYMTKGAHAPQSQHSLGLAADGHLVRFDPSRNPSDEDIVLLTETLRKIINKPKKTIFEQALLAWLADFHGVGIYPDWTPKPGLHLDKRPTKEAVVWIGLNKEKLEDLIDKTEGPQVYVYLA